LLFFKVRKEEFCISEKKYYLKTTKIRNYEQQ
jgi:hypothetical protein